MHVQTPALQIKTHTTSLSQLMSAFLLSPWVAVFYLFVFNFLTSNLTFLPYGNGRDAPTSARKP